MGVGVTAITLLLVLIATRYPKLIGRRGAYAATGVVVCGNEVLLAFNPRQKRWLPPGSHIHGVQEPHEVVLAAIEREGGCTAQFHPCHDPVRPIDNFSKQVPQPFLVQKEYQILSEGHVFHYDFFYLLTVQDHNAPRPAAHDKKWVTLEALEDIVNNGETYPDVLRVVKRGFEIISKHVENAPGRTK